ncbi:hypothetical protein FHS18_004423 [Paenibacillus phyllosphaerae]|uniref:Uncharacterized protein n=1 Tax=Paenibacillus phyllosphaerae TaxID=274593 RepID=A0A7W5B151_9BACL|nr:hypothetical protein [Paenibacillus phyllosphaerae]MBB3112337.1 hypothetical protein [Paenibacillus phyllosphaerae]
MINSKRMFMIAALSAAISLGGLMPDRASASPLPVKAKEAGLQSSVPSEAEETLFVRVLGADSAEEVKDALYNGSSLADIASSNSADIDQLIQLQVAQLALQLQERLQAGSISQAQFEAQLAELHEIVASSVFAQYA